MSTYDIKVRTDRIGRYFKKYLAQFLFSNFSEAFLIQADLEDIMKDIPIPLRKEDAEDFAGGGGLPMLKIAENMAWIMGCDPHFKYTEAYVTCINKLYDYQFYEKVVAQGKAAAAEGDADSACIHFRAALCMCEDYLDAMYSYARICRAMYLNNNNEEYIGRFKAEALEYFELITQAHPEFDKGYYYLGYAYINMGLYKKAELVWKEFIKLTKNAKDKKEIKARLDQLKEPVKIEEGCNLIATGRYDEGLERLEPFADSGYKKWWPLFYYLGIGYIMTGQTKEAVRSFKDVLKINASHIETMRELTNIYAAEGDQENLRKYQQKIQLIEEGMEADRKQTMSEIEAGDKALLEKEPEKVKPEIIENIEVKKKKEQNKKKEKKAEKKPKKR